MGWTALYNSDIFALVILPLLIFTARVLDVSLGTIRLIFVMRGYKYLALLLAFFEVLIWLLAISQIMQNLTNITYYLAFAGGFATGNFVGIYIEENLALGTLIVRIICMKEADQLTTCLKSAGYGVTTVNAHGTQGEVNLVYSIIKRKNLPEVIKHIKKCTPNAFFSIEEIRSASKGVFPSKKSHYKKGVIPLELKRK